MGSVSQTIFRALDKMAAGSGLGTRLGIDSIRLGIDSIRLGIDSIRLGIDSIRLGIDSIRLGIDSIRLGIDSIRLGIDSIRLGIDSVQFEIDSIWLGSRPAFRIANFETFGQPYRPSQLAPSLFSVTGVQYRQE